MTKTASKGNRALGFIKRNIKTPSTETKEKAYNALVRPTLEYASSVWSPGQKNLSQTIEKVQRRAARYVSNLQSSRDSVSLMLSHLKWDTLEQRRAKSRVTMLYKIVNSLVEIPATKLIPASRKTRGHTQKFLQIKTRTNYHKFSFFPCAIRHWNSLSSDLVSAADIDIFKERLKPVSINLDY